MRTATLRVLALRLAISAEKMASVNLSKGAAELLRNAVVVNASSKHSATLLFLHGLGDTG